jgi:hypothetical protein
MNANTILGSLVVVLGLCVALAGTNPTSADYCAFLEASLKQALEQMQAEPEHQREVIRYLLAEQGKKIIGSVIRANTIRRNYGLFSIFETQAFDVRVVVVGVGRQFIPVDGQEEIVRKLGRLVL